MDDLISRAEALNALKDMSVTYDAETVQRCIEAVSNLPSAQPTVDAVPVIRCKDCELNKSIGDWVECPISEMYGRKASDNYCSVAVRKEE